MLDALVVDEESGSEIFLDIITNRRWSSTSDATTRSLM
jgi:hypothetical protein